MNESLRAKLCSLQPSFFMPLFTQIAKKLVKPKIAIFHSRVKVDTNKRQSLFECTLSCLINVDPRLFFSQNLSHPPHKNRPSTFIIIFKLVQPPRLLEPPRLFILQFDFQPSTFMSMGQRRILVSSKIFINFPMWTSFRPPSTS